MHVIATRSTSLSKSMVSMDSSMISISYSAGVRLPRIPRFNGGREKIFTFSKIPSLLDGLINRIFFTLVLPAGLS